MFDIKHDREINLGAPCHALSLSPDSKQFVVGTKEVRIINSLNGHFRTHSVLRSSSQSSTHTEAQWNPSELYSQYIVSAPTSGGVLLWNLQKDGTKRLENRMEDHLRSVNRLCWHHSEPHVFSASMDGSVKLWSSLPLSLSLSLSVSWFSSSMICPCSFILLVSCMFCCAFLWGMTRRDVKTPKRSSLSFSGTSGCRDVKLNPHNPFLIAAGYFYVLSFKHPLIQPVSFSFYPSFCCCLNTCAHSYILSYIYIYIYIYVYVQW